LLRLLFSAVSEFTPLYEIWVKKLNYVEETGTVIYHSKMTCGKNKKNFVVYRAEDFIAAICQHIPKKFFQMVRYVGYYSNKSRGMRRKEGILRPCDEPLPEVPPDVDIIDVSEYNPPHVPSKPWRECIKKLKTFSMNLAMTIGPFMKSLIL